MRNFVIQIRIRPQDLKTNAILQIFVFGCNNAGSNGTNFSQVQPESVWCHVLHYNCMREGATAIEKEQDEGLLSEMLDAVSYGMTFLL